jgi:hypothetical protein
MPNAPEHKLPASRRGRPVGSVSLTEEIQQQIVAMVRAGAFAHVAASAAGVPERTFYEWLERGEQRHPTRSSTSKLRAFALAVRTAQSEARAAAEIRVHREHPRYWLTHAARTKPGSEGWTQPPPEQANQAGERLAELIRSLDEREEEEP